MVNDLHDHGNLALLGAGLEEDNCTRTEGNPEPLRTSCFEDETMEYVPRPTSTKRLKFDGCAYWESKAHEHSQISKSSKPCPPVIQP